MKNKLKLFSIKKLYGIKNVDILFNNDTKIIVGENGMGKTTILSALYYTLTCKFDRLRSIEFDTINIQFQSGLEIGFKRDDIIIFNKSNSRLVSKIRATLDEDEFIQLVEDISNNGKYHHNVKNQIMKLANTMHAHSPTRILMALEEYCQRDSNPSPIELNLN